MIEPTVGRQVWYLPSQADKAGPGGMACMRQPLAATIVCVLPAGCVNLAVLDAQGRLWRRLSVRLLQSNPDPEIFDESTGYAIWPAIAPKPAPAKPTLARVEATGFERVLVPFDKPTLARVEATFGTDAPDLGSLETSEADALPFTPAAPKPAAPFLTRAALEKLIVGEYYAIGSDLIPPTHKAAFARHHMGRLTVCILLLHNGYTVIGTSAPISAANFDAEKGRQAARESAIEKLWPLEGYLLRDQLHQDECGPVHVASATDAPATRAAALAGG